jgi:predicted ribosome quality control (RQC) complex YloA/Tae2 family protein
MKQLSLIDLYYLVSEMRDLLVNERLDNFYYENGILYLKVYIRGKGHWYVVNWVSKALYLSTAKQEASEPDSFVKFLRKYLKNGFIRGVDIYEEERIVRFSIERMESGTGALIHYYLFLELFANGNVIVTDEAYTIKNALELRRFRDRKILVRHPYELPPRRDLSIFSVDEASLFSLLQQADRQVVKVLALQLGVGGKFAEELCYRCDIEKTRPASQITEEDVSKLVKRASILINEESVPQGVYEGDELRDFLPYPFSSIPEEKQSGFSSFYELLRAYFEQFLREYDPKEVELQKELKKLYHRLEKLEQQKSELLERYEELNEKGNLIYYHYQEIEDLLTGIREAAKGRGWEYVKKRVEEEPSLKRWIKEINEQNNEIILELGPAGKNT